MLCGLTDILDGYLARKMKLVSTFGAKLDSLADLELTAITVVCLLITFRKDLLLFLPYIAVVTFIRLLNLLTAYIRFHSFLILHTWGNKAAGVFIYASICIYMATEWKGIIYLTMMIAILSAAEELLIHLTSKEPDPDRRGLFLK
jgi:CDP-diacylglycerol--glycerol-3-phosphate 3-phosphatidyltransferase